MKRLSLLVVSALAIISSVRSDRRYAVIAPGTLYPHHKYTATVVVHDTTEPVSIKISVKGPSYNENQLVKLSPNEVKNIDFQVPSLLKNGEYSLTAEGVTGITFTNSTTLVVGNNPTNVKIQLDKGKYKPGDIVNFRIIFFDENLRPATPLPNAMLWFEDSKSNRIKEFKNLKTIKGVYTDQLQLSQFPTLGGWRLIVQENPDNHLNYGYFEVEKYVLPKYNVKVESTSKVSLRDGDMQAVVRSNYTYGKPVNGMVTLVLSLGSYYYHNTDGIETAQPIIHRTEMVNGKAKFNFNIKEWSNKFPDKSYPYYATVTATVEEHSTGAKINGTATTQVFPYRYIMSCANYKDCSSFNPNEEMEIPIQITYVDGTPISDTKNTVKIILNEEIRRSSWWQGSYEPDLKDLPFPDIKKRSLTFESHLNETGVAKFKVILPELEEIRGFHRYFSGNVSYLDENRSVMTTNQNRKPKKIEKKPDEENEDAKKYFKIKVGYKEKQFAFDIGEEMTFTVNSSEPLKYFIYVVIARANILHSERVDLPTPAKEYKIQFKSSFAMSPNGKLFIYYIDSNGEFHYTNKYFRVNVELQNKIQIFADDQVKPGDEVSLTIKTATNSFVALTAVDQSVLMLDASNNINYDDFKWQLGIFDTYTMWNEGVARRPGEEIGLITLSNANFPSELLPPPQPKHSTYNLLRSAPKMSSLGRLPAGDEGVALEDSVVFAARGGNPVPEVHVRRNFIETWIFDNIENTDSETFTWNKKIPDTITSWVLSGFSVHPDLGIGVTKETTKITTFQPFFIAIRLPYSVKRGEVLNVPALVFNYLDKDLDVEITLDNTDGEFDFTDVSNEVINESRRTRSIRVPASEARPASFLIRPKSVGNILLKLTAKSPIAADAIHKTLKVEPEGITKYANRAFFINLNDKPKLQESFELDLPSEVVPDSQHIEFTVVGDLLGPILKNLDRLVRLPTGCGEQTLSAMMPNYYVYKYLANSGQLNEDIGAKLKNNLEKGYQNLLRYAHEDGSFSSFGPKTDNEKPRNGSTWLTAYAMRSLHKIGDLISIDFTILDKGLAYLAARQAENGSFIEQGEFFYSSQNKHISLTAAVVRAFIENSDAPVVYDKNSNKGLDYLQNNIEKADNLYTKVLAGYALHLAKRPKATKLIQAMKDMARTDEDRMWWSEAERSDKWWCGLFSNDVEITSYMLLALLDNDHETPQTVLPIVKWLVAQRNSYGGFVSSQDTIVGLQALIKFAEKSNYKPGIMSIDWTAKGAREKRETIKIDDSNGLLLQTNELPQKTEKVEFEASGTGTALVQVSYQYNVVEKDPKPSFLLDAVVNKNSPSHQLLLEVCVEYTGEGDASNMAILEVSLPSGFAADEESFGAIKDVDNVRLVETKNADSVIVVYFSSLPKNKKQCIPIEGTRAHIVAKQKPASVVVYDYYEASRRMTTFYNVAFEVCEICQEDCLEECSKQGT